MRNYQLKTPVAFVIFNRPNNTAKVFETIRKAQPPKLLVIADGPREDKPGEAEKCAATRAIIDRVDWNCEVIKNYSDENMGMKLREASGFDWVFNNVEEAIILEDDTLPHLSFFRFCDELLEKYRHDQRIMTISGTNPLREWKSDIQSYHFAYYSSYWGWASWRRAWNYYDIEMKLWSKSAAKKSISNVICDQKQYQNRAKIFDYTYSGKIQTWDYQWDFARLLQSGLSIVPSKNLISNIGFGTEATNTFIDFKGVSNLPLMSLSFPLREPCGVSVDREYDYLRYKKAYALDFGLKKQLYIKSKRLLYEIQRIYKTKSKI